jgi:hypothetical protein
MGGTPSSQCLNANKYPGLELGQPFMTQTISVKKMALICQISTTNFSREPKYSKGFLNLKKKKSYLMYSRIWLNLLVDDHQFGYITTLTKQTLYS